MKRLHLETTDSTSRVAWELLESTEPPLVVTADVQTAGRGRGSNAWVSTKGNLFLSLGTSLPAERLHNVSVRIAIAIALQLNELAKDSLVRVKWPNDLMIGNAKLGGILTESRIRGNHALLVVGVGANVRHAPIPESACLSDHLRIGLEAAASLIASAILDGICSDSGDVVNQLDNVSWFQPGDPVSWLAERETHRGRFLRYDRDLAMVVTSGGIEQPLMCSTVTRIRQADDSAPWEA